MDSTDKFFFWTNLVFAVLAIAVLSRSLPGVFCALANLANVLHIGYLKTNWVPRGR